MQPAVSVIMPTYNRADYLKNAVQSVLDQTFNNFEIIIINNYSTDDTLEVINAFNDDRIKVINFKNEGIIAKSRNQGIMQSVGKYIAFLDDDDLWCPDKLELQVKYLDEHPEIDLVYSNALIIDEHGTRKGLFKDPKQAKTGRVFLNLLYENFVPILTVLMKREIFESIGPLTEDTSIIGREDYECWLNASLKYNFGYIDKPLALYRIHSEGVSTSLNRPLMTQKTLRSFISNPEVPKEYHSKIISNIERMNADVAVHYWSVSDNKNARTYAKKYIHFKLKHIHIFGAFIGFLLYVVVNFKYAHFVRLIKCITKIRKPLNL